MDGGWNNNRSTVFSDLLAHVEMDVVDYGSGTQGGSNNAAGTTDGSSFPISHSPIDNDLHGTCYSNMLLDLDLNIPIESFPWDDDINYTPDIPQCEFLPGLYCCSYDHNNSLSGKLADVVSNGSIPFQLAPKTPDFGKGAQQNHHYEIGNICQEERLYLQKNKKQDAVDQLRHDTSELLCEETFLHYETNFSSVAASTQLEENDVLDNAEEETGIDLHKTPAHKAKRRKIRPKVVLEGKVKGTPKSNVKEKSNVENQSGKRRYTRKNESKSSNAPSTNVIEEATTDQVVVKSCKRKLRFQYEETRLTLLAGSEFPPPDRSTGFNGIAGTKVTQHLAQGQEAAVENFSAVECDLNFSCTELLEDYISLPENLSMSSVLHGASEAMGCRQSEFNASPSASYIRDQLQLAWPLYDLIDGNNEFSAAEQNAVIPYVGDGRMVPYEGLFDPSKKRSPRAKVDLDPEDDRVWKLLMGIDTSNCVEGTSEDKEEWWEEQRRLYHERAHSFI